MHTTNVAVMDIGSRADIDRLMHHFYERALADDVIGYIFMDVAKLDLEHHLPVIGDFWESMLFQSGNYARHGRSPMQVHHALHLQERLTAAHFRRWLEIFVRTVDDEFAGERAELIKMRARAIAHRFYEVLSAVD